MPHLFCFFVRTSSSITRPPFRLPINSLGLLTLRCLQETPESSKRTTHYPYRLIISYFRLKYIKNMSQKHQVRRYYIENAMSLFACRFINYVGTDVAIILLIFSNLDRLIACWNPLRASRYCTVRIALLEIAGVTCFAVLLNITTPIIRTITYPAYSTPSPPTPTPTQQQTPSAFMYSSSSSPDEWTGPYSGAVSTITATSPSRQSAPQCTDKVESHPLNWYQQRMQPWIVLVLVSVVPELCVFTFNALLLAGLARHERRLRSFTLTNTAHKNLDANSLTAAGFPGNLNGQQKQRSNGASPLRPHSFSTLAPVNRDRGAIREERKRAVSALTAEEKQMKEEDQTSTPSQTLSPVAPLRQLSTVLELPSSANSPAAESRFSPNSSLNSNTPMCPIQNGNGYGVVHSDPVQKRDLLTRHSAAAAGLSLNTSGSAQELAPILQRNSATDVELNKSNSSVPRVASSSRLREGSATGVGTPLASLNASPIRTNRMGKLGSASGNSVSFAATGNQSSGGGSSPKDRERTTYVLTLGISLLFLVLYTPILFLRPFEAYIDNGALYRSLQTLLSMLQHTFHCADFYVYVAISRAYRQKLLRVLGTSFRKTKWGGATEAHTSRGAIETATQVPVVQVTQVHQL